MSTSSKSSIPQWFNLSIPQRTINVKDANLTMSLKKIRRWPLRRRRRKKQLYNGCHLEWYNVCIYKRIKVRITVLKTNLIKRGMSSFFKVGLGGVCSCSSWQFNEKKREYQLNQLKKFLKTSIKTIESDHFQILVSSSCLFSFSCA